MKLQDLICPNCGAHLQADANLQQAHCEHCGTTILIADEVNHIKIDNAEETGYNFEKGRQRALEEKTTALNDKAKEKKEEKEKKDLKMRFCHSAYEIVEMIGAIAVCIIICFSFVVRLNVVDGPSMENTLHTGEYLVVSDLFYTPRRGDIIVFQDMTVAEQYRKPLVKRVIATEGETVEINFNTWELKIDGEVVDESAFRQLKNDGSPVTATLEGYDRLTNTLTVTVEPGHVFVMGDNRNHSADSRLDTIGQIDRRAVVGHVLCRIYPLTKFSLFPNPYK